MTGIGQTRASASPQPREDTEGIHRPQREGNACGNIGGSGLKNTGIVTNELPTLSLGMRFVMGGLSSNRASAAVPLTTSTLTTKITPSRWK